VCALRFTRHYDASPAVELDWEPPGEQPSVVCFELRANGAGTVLVLDHRRIDARRGMRTMRLWERHLEQLDALLGVEVERE